MNHDTSSNEMMMHDLIQLKRQILNHVSHAQLERHAILNDHQCSRYNIE